MDRFSLSREPAVWIGLLSAVVAALAIFGVDLPDGAEAAIAFVITAGSAVFIRSKVRPASQSITVEPDTAVVVHEPANAAGRLMESEYQLVDGKVKQTAAAVEVPLYGDPASVKAKSRADLKAEHDRARDALGIARPLKKASKKKGGR